MIPPNRLQMQTRKRLPIHPHHHHRPQLSLPIHGRKATTRPHLQKRRWTVLVIRVSGHNLTGVESGHQEGEFELHRHFCGEGVMEDGVGGENVLVCEAGEVVYGDVAVGTDDDRFNCGSHGWTRGGVGEGRDGGGHGGTPLGDMRMVLRF